MAEVVSDLRVLVLGVSWPPETFLERLIRGLAEKGVQVTIGSAQPVEGDGLDWLPMPKWNVSYPGRILRLAGLTALALARSPRDFGLVFSADGGDGMLARAAGLARSLPLCGRRWDVVYFPWNSAAADSRSVFMLGMPVVISCRGSQINIAPHNPQRSVQVADIRESLAKAAVVHCVSDDIRKKAEELGAETGRCRVIRPAVDPDFFLPDVEQKGGGGILRLVTTGSLIWCKGCEDLLVALRRLIGRGAPAVLDIIGDGPDRNRILYTIDDLGLRTAVTLSGKLPPEEVRDRLNQADAFVLASLSEGISNAVLEAMSCGLPVVTTGCGGMREAVNDGVEGFVVPRRHPDAMADALHRLAGDPELRGRMGEAGRSRVLRDFTLDHQVGQWCSLLTDVAVSGVSQRAEH